MEIRAFKIIFNSQCIDYESLCTFYNMDTFKDRRNRLCKVFFEKNVLSESSCLSY